MKQYTEYEVQKALQAITDGHGIRQAAREWGIPYPTLRHRLYGTQSRGAAFAGLQRLSETQESLLAGWVSTQAALGSAPTHQQVRELARYMLGNSQPLAQPLRRKWTQRFLHRNPSIRTQRSRLIDSRHKTGIIKGRGSNGLVLGSSETRYV
ncbi:transposase [Colletotrichum incanum]|uniref:Transposase n=1 Tax=Colletotrichum incanum TaxID=1573173 RepID=A0A167CGW6_COLIC|nr:transposase [Colletotrichum incanum]